MASAAAAAAAAAAVAAQMQYIEEHIFAESVQVAILAKHQLEVEQLKQYQQAETNNVAAATAVAGQVNLTLCDKFILLAIRDKNHKLFGSNAFTCAALATANVIELYKRGFISLVAEDNNLVYLNLNEDKYASDKAQLEQEPVMSQMMVSIAKYHAKLETQKKTKQRDIKEWLNKFCGNCFISEEKVADILTKAVAAAELKHAIHTTVETYVCFWNSTTCLQRIFIVLITKQQITYLFRKEVLCWWYHR